MRLLRLDTIRKVHNQANRIFRYIELAIAIDTSQAFDRKVISLLKLITDSLEITSMSKSS